MKNLTAVLKSGKVPEFSDLEFVKHPLPGAVQAVLLFENGYGVSTVGGPLGLYGDGVNTFEIAVIHAHDGANWSICYSTPITNDVLEGVPKADIEEVLRRVSSMEANRNCTHQ